MLKALYKAILGLIGSAILAAGIFFLLLSPSFLAFKPFDGPVFSGNDPFQDEKLQVLIENMIDEHQLDRQNLCLVIKNLQDQREYRLNENRAFFAASVYKLPLTMLYYEDYLNCGKSGMDDFFGTLDHETICQDIEAAIVDSSNEAAKELFDNLGGWSRYAGLRERYRSRKADPDLLDQECQANYIDGAYLSDTLEYLYVHQQDFSELLSFLSRAQPEAYLNGLVSELYLQKYGAYEQCLNIVGLNLKKVPYLVIVLSDEQQGMESFMADLGQELDLYFNPKPVFQENELSNQTSPWSEQEDLIQASDHNPVQISEIDDSDYAESASTAQSQTEAAFEPALPKQPDLELTESALKEACLAAGP